MRRFSSRADADDEVHEPEVTPSIRAADEQDRNLSGLGRGGQEQVGSGSESPKSGTIVPQGQRQSFIHRHAEAQIGIAAAPRIDMCDPAADIAGDIMNEAQLLKRTAGSFGYRKVRPSWKMDQYSCQTPHEGIFCANPDAKQLMVQSQ